MGTPSVYSHVTTRSSANLKSSRSMRSIRIPWYQRPILQDAIVLDIQRGALVTGFYSLVSWYSEVVHEIELEICLLVILYVFRYVDFSGNFAIGLVIFLDTTFSD